MSTTKAGKGLIDTLPAYSDNFCRQNKKLLYSIVVKCYGNVKNSLSRDQANSH